MRKQVGFLVLTESIHAPNAPLFSRVANLLKSGEGWEVISSVPIGIDTGGGVSGAGSVMMAVSLVQYANPTKEQVGGVPI